MLPISREVLLAELEGGRALIDKWVTKVSEGIPGVDLPVQDVDTVLGDFLRELIGELRIIAGKCDTIAEVLSDST